MEYNADGTMKLPAKPLVNEKIHTPALNVDQRLSALEARVTALENQKPADAPPAPAEGAVS